MFVGLLSEFLDCCTCQFDPSAAQRTSQQLPPLDLDSRLGAVDVDALETTNTWALGLKHARKAPTSGGLT